MAAPPIATTTIAPRDPLARLLAPGTDASYALLRVLAGLLFAFHGAQKLFDLLLPPGITIPVGSQVWIGGVIELVCGLAIAAGFRTAWAAFLASGTMAVAYVQFHWKLAFDTRFLPVVNQGELAVVYALLFLYVACRGGGRYSLDGQRLGASPK